MNQAPVEITPPPGPKYEGGFSFMRSVQPVLDRYCIGCHGLGKQEGKMNLLGNHGGASKAGGMPPFKFDNKDSYASLTTKKGVVKMALRRSNDGPDSETVNSRPGEFFARASKLAPMLIKGHNKVRLDELSLRRIIQWLDMNCIRYGSYSRRKVEWRRLSKDGEKSVREFVKERFGEKLAAQPMQALVNVAQIDESRILKAPLPLAAGGWGQIENGYGSTDDPDYVTMRSLIRKALGE